MTTAHDDSPAFEQALAAGDQAQVRQLYYRSDEPPAVPLASAPKISVSRRGAFPMRVRNRRTGKWIELPDEDGLVPLPYMRRHNDKIIERGIKLVTPEYAHELAVGHMTVIDALAPLDRWKRKYLGRNGRCLLDNTTPAPPQKRGQRHLNIQAKDLGL